jgi:hypothetical protein
MAAAPAPYTSMASACGAAKHNSVAIAIPLLIGPNPFMAVLPSAAR